MGVEFATKKLEIGGQVIKLQIWDTVTCAHLSVGRPGILQDHHSGLL